MIEKIRLEMGFRKEAVQRRILYSALRIVIREDKTNCSVFVGKGV
jgi:hypothetical protein